MKKYLSVILVPIFIIGFAFAQEPIVSDRPDQTEASVTVPHKSFQIESGFAFSFSNNTSSLSTPNTLFRYGLFPFLELRFYNEVLIEKNSMLGKNSGISDLQVGIKLQIFEREDNPTSVAFLSHLIAPSGSDYFSAKAWGNTSRVLVTHQIGARHALGYNLGYTYLNSKKGDFIYTLSYAHALTEKFGFFAEIYGEWIEFENALLNADAGLTYLIKPNLQLDASYGIGLNQRMNFLGLGMSWNIAPRQVLAAPAND